MTEKSHRQTLTVEIDSKTNAYDPNNKNKFNSLRRQTWMGKYDWNKFGHLLYSTFVINSDKIYFVYLLKLCALLISQFTW